MILREGNLEFTFIGAISAFKFDEQDGSLATFHGLSHCMKAVDFVAEYPDHYLFVEIKDQKYSTRYSSDKNRTDLIKNLVIKFRDTFVYRWAEAKLDKPVRYQCLVELDNAQTLYLMKQLKQMLPANKVANRWSEQLVSLCSVTNASTWNKTFSTVQVARI